MIVTRLSGGLGNQMFQYAVARSVALKNNTKVGLDVYDLLDHTPRPGFTFREYCLDIFNIEAEVVDQSLLPFRYRSLGGGSLRTFLNKIRRKFLVGLGKEQGFKFNKDIFHLGDKAYLDGYWQSYKYFEDYSDIIRKDFTFKKPFEEKINLLKKEIEGTESVCLHVRKGDYVGNSFHYILSPEYYYEALKVILENVAVDKIYVFSDDVDWCQAHLKFNLPIVFVSRDYAGYKDSGHLALMMSCKNFIIANSSFSWWAAWLASNENKVVVAPKNWFGRSDINTSNRIPKEWIRI